VSTLEPVVGAQRIRASVNVDYDSSSSEENQETYDPKSAVAVTMQTSEEKTSGGETTGGVPGTASNVPNANTPAKSEDENDDTVQSSKTQNATYAVDKVVRRTIQRWEESAGLRQPCSLMTQSRSNRQMERAPRPAENGPRKN